jgi:multisubunit Na+/H+ antiporter MnhG subunit
MRQRETHWLGILDPEAFRRFHGHGTCAGPGLGFVILAVMAYYEAPLRWTIVTSFVFVILALSQLIKDAAIWIEARVEQARTSS